MTVHTPAHERVVHGRSGALVGPVLIGIGILHTATAPIFHGPALRGIVEGGVIAAVESDPAQIALRSAGFWYLTAGFAVMILGALLWWTQRRIGTLPGGVGWLVLGIAVWGVLLMPVSGFYLFLLPAGLAWHAARDDRVGRT
jgi:hypothetical protein